MGKKKFEQKKKKEERNSTWNKTFLFSWLVASHSVNLIWPSCPDNHEKKNEVIFFGRGRRVKKRDHLVNWKEVKLPLHNGGGERKM